MDIIFWVAAFFLMLAVLFGIVVLLALFCIVRAWIKGDDALEIDRTQPPVRTRIKHAQLT